jgi:hypothetical protein
MQLQGWEKLGGRRPFGFLQTEQVHTPCLATTKLWCSCVGFMKTTKTAL